MFFPPYGDTIGSIVVKHVNGQFVDVISGKIYPACVNFYEGKVVRIEHRPSAPMRYLLPGLIDSHVHIESSLLTPYRFAEQAVAHGTAAVVADPTPAGTMAGIGAVEFMRQDGKSTPLRFYWTAPSSLPASTGLDWKGVKELMEQQDVVSLGEVSEVDRVLREDPETISKMEVAAQFGKPIDGHAPGLSGYDLDRYIMAGVSNDHESTSVVEAEEKMRRGMTVVIKDGTTSHHLEALAPFAAANRHLLATGYLGTGDLMEGHIDALLRREVAAGVDPIQAIRAATMWPAEYYRLAGGSLYVGGPADLVVVDDLQEFRVQETWIGGELVAKDGRALFAGNLSTMGSPFVRGPVERSQLTISARSGVGRYRVMEVGPTSHRPGRGTASVSARDGLALPDPGSDLAVLGFVEPSGEQLPRASFVRGFGLRTGAVASSSIFGARGLITVGTDPSLAAGAANAVLDMGGGIAVTDGRETLKLPLPIAGMLSSLPAEEVARGVNELTAMLRSMGCPLDDPLVYLAMLGHDLNWALGTEPEGIAAEAHWA